MTFVTDILSWLLITVFALGAIGIGLYLVDLIRWALKDETEIHGKIWMKKEQNLN